METSTFQSATQDQYMPQLSVLRSITVWLRKNGLYTLGGIMVIIVVFVAVFAPVISPHDPTLQNSKIRLKPPAWANGGDPSYILGTDHLGRDIVSRIFYGARISLIVGIFAVLSSGSVGVILGVITGYLGGKFDAVTTGLIDAQLAFPFVLLAIAVIAVLGPGLINVLIVLTLSNWVIFARLARGITMTVKEREFILAAQSIGSSNLRIIIYHILPQVITPVIVVANIQVGQMILAESALSFLGMGVPASTPTWGGMLSDGRSYMWQAPWLTIFPGLAIVFAVLGITYLGDWIRVVIDPKYRGR